MSTLNLYFQLSDRNFLNSAHLFIFSLADLLQLKTNQFSNDLLWIYQLSKLENHRIIRQLENYQAHTKSSFTCCLIWNCDKVLRMQYKILSFEMIWLKRRIFHFLFAKIDSSNILSHSIFMWLFPWSENGISRKSCTYFNQDRCPWPREVLCGRFHFIISSLEYITYMTRT